MKAFLVIIPLLTGCMTTAHAEEPKTKSTPSLSKMTKPTLQTAKRIEIDKQYLAKMQRILINLQVESVRTCAQANEPNQLWFCNIDQLLEAVAKDIKPAAQCTEESPEK